MKKLILLLLLVTLPLGLFAQFYLGGSALYKEDPKYLQDVQSADQSFFNDLALGAEARLKLGMFEISGLALYEFDNAFDVYLDAGVSFDIAILTIGAGIGPNFIIQADPDAPESTSIGFNGKIHADLNLGDIKISAYWLILVESLSYKDFSDNLTAGNVGVSVLFKL
ncbi:MAG: hypothetical protein P8107_07160 [Spirochaetia bacterium]|jgi:hypothetical protein